MLNGLQPKQIRLVWNAAKEAFQDALGYSEDDWSDARFELWKADPLLRPELWQVAWDGDEVAGMVLNYIIDEENQTYGRSRGYTSVICTRRPWRRRGLARALLARSLKLLNQGVVVSCPHSMERQADNKSVAFRNLCVFCKFLYK